MPQLPSVFELINHPLQNNFGLPSAPSQKPLPSEPEGATQPGHSMLLAGSAGSQLSQAGRAAMSRSNSDGSCQKAEYNNFQTSPEVIKGGRRLTNPHIDYFNYYSQPRVSISSSVAPLTRNSSQNSLSAGVVNASAFTRHNSVTGAEYYDGIHHVGSSPHSAGNNGMATALASSNICGNQASSLNNAALTPAGLAAHPSYANNLTGQLHHSTQMNVPVLQQDASPIINSTSSPSGHVAGNAIMSSGYHGGRISFSHTQPLYPPLNYQGALSNPYHSQRLLVIQVDQPALVAAGNYEGSQASIQGQLAPIHSHLNSTNNSYEYPLVHYQVHQTPLYYPLYRDIQYKADENNALLNKRRIIKRRTRTGCLTCRKRRIKCDERKPHCYNCERSKKICLGYEDLTKIKKKRDKGKDEERGDEKESTDELKESMNNESKDVGVKEEHHDHIINQDGDESLKDESEHDETLLNHKNDRLKEDSGAEAKSDNERA